MMEQRLIYVRWGYDFPAKPHGSGLAQFFPVSQLISGKAQEWKTTLQTPLYEQFGKKIDTEIDDDFEFHWAPPNVYSIEQYPTG
jgi:hypothetical protein